MVAEVDSELREIHHVRYTPTPYAAAYVDWSVDPYGGARTTGTSTPAART